MQSRSVVKARPHNVLYSSSSSIKGNCIPEMRKDWIYCLQVALSLNTFEKAFAKCGCPAGIGPQGSCKHKICGCWNTKSIS